MKQVLVIGAGGIAHRHLRGLCGLHDVELGIVEPVAQRREAVCEAYGIKRCWTQVSEADLTDFDAAFICAPAHVHVPLARACVEAGLPFLLEKPLAVTMAGVDDLVAAAAARRVAARVGYVRRASPETQAFADQVRSGRIGDVRMCVVRTCQDFRKYRPDYRETYYARPEMGGGVILDAASHMIDLLLWIMGPVTEVGCMYDRLVFEGTRTEDSALISLRFASGAMAQLTLNQFQKPNTATVEMCGTRGNLRLDCVAASIAYADDDSGTWTEEGFLDGESFMDFHNRRFRRQAEYFFAAAAGESCPLTTLEEARDNLRIALAAKESYNSKRIVPV